ncbi:MAG: hypothetical protein GY745_01105 [Actinomycetia bacterium]|nr:hypothetical protein [Actinomycetes bacterium]MCP3912953.1 hypothetical protein [Actinomycetes bacterium]MCP4083646.1 hypothetical protein [Actinomycetes bacterium]
MIPSLAIRALVMTTGLVAMVGAVDATIGKAYDLVAVFVSIALVQLMLLIRLGSRRRDVTLRADLAVWTRDRASSQAETSEAILDRAVAAYRAELLGVERPDTDPRP